MSHIVIVTATAKFTRIAVDAANNEIEDWVIENIGEYESRKRSYFAENGYTNITIVYSFFTKEDAMAFKLRWC